MQRLFKPQSWLSVFFVILSAFPAHSDAQYVAFVSKPTEDDVVSLLRSFEIDRAGVVHLLQPKNIDNTTKRGGPELVWITGRAEFSENSKRLLSSEFGFVDAVGRALLKDASLVVAITSHKDADGSQVSASQQALAVQRYLHDVYRIGQSRLVPTKSKGNGATSAENIFAVSNNNIMIGTLVVIDSSSYRTNNFEVREEADVDAVAKLLALLRKEGQLPIGE